MSKNLPYFKFTVANWLTGDIFYESLGIQGLFINICAIYWQRKGDLSIDDINKRFKNPAELKEMGERFFSIENGIISINFLDEQFTERKSISVTNAKNGLKGGRPKALKTKEIKPNANLSETEVKPNESNIEKKREEKKREEKKREELFASDFNFDFVEPNFKTPFETWIKYRAEKKKPFTLQVSLESCYKELKELSGGYPLQAIKIVQTCISNEYLSLCISDKTFKKNINQSLQYDI